MRLLPLIATVVLFAAPASAQVQLRFKFTPGEVLRQKTVQEMKMAAEVQGQKLNTEMTQTMNIEQAVESVDADGGARVRQKINRIRMSMKAPLGQGFEFDSADESVGQAPAAITNMLKKMAGAEFQARIAPTGQYSEVTIPEDLEKALKGAPGSPFGGDGSDSLKQMMGQSAATFPEQPVRTGDSWSDDLTMKMQFGEMKIHRTNTYAGTNEEGLHVINIALDMEIAPGENQQIRMKIKDSNAQGTLLFDNAKGRVVRTDLEQTMTMETSVMGQSFESTIKQRATTELEPESAQ